MKLHSHRINWSLVLIATLLSAVAAPGNAYSQQRERVTSQQDHRQRARGEERVTRKDEKPVRPEETRRRRPAPSDASETNDREQVRPTVVSPPQRARNDTPQPNMLHPDARRYSGDAARQPIARERTTHIPAAAPDRQRFERPNEVLSTRTEVRQNQFPHAVTAIPSSQRPSQRDDQNSRPINRNPIVTNDQNRRPTPGGPLGQSDRHPGYRADDNRGNGSHVSRPRQPSQTQERRIRAEQHQANQYYASQSRHRDTSAQRSRVLQQQRRNNQYRYQNQYQQRLHQQRSRWTSVHYDYYSDPFYYTPANYRYQFGGQWQTTNRYGADLMRQAVEHGYQEGVRAGSADRQDGWRADYGNSYAYQDGSYGYNGRYISPSEYQHYFRQGFRRGYQDGYSGRYSYGYRQNDGNYVVVAAVLAAIVGLHLSN